VLSSSGSRLDRYTGFQSPSPTTDTFAQQENGVAVAIESIYRDMEYARSLIKRQPVGQDDDIEEDDEESGRGTIRRSKGDVTPFSPGSFTSTSSIHGRTPSEDWSVISEQDERDRRSSSGSNRSRSRSKRDKRRSFTAAMLSVLPDSLAYPGSTSPTKASSPTPAV
jgi:sterol 3beta-glucosyltransferase